MTELQVLVAVYGEEGIARMAAHSYPPVEGVEYLVAWQLPGGDAQVPAPLCRPDVRVIKSCTRGLSANRNIAIDAATAPLVLIADDDLDYTEAGLRGVIDAFRRNPDADILTFKYESERAVKLYPDFEFDWSRPTRKVPVYVTSFEIAARLDSLRRCGVRFDERFGIGGAQFICGEEDIFMDDALKRGLRGRFVPVTICRHEGYTTSERMRLDPRLIEAKGGVFVRKFPLSWPLRMLAHVVRNRRLPRAERLSTGAYLRAWLAGAGAGAIGAHPQAPVHVGSYRK